MIQTFVTMIRGNQSVFLKAPELFCLYRDSEKLPIPPFFMGDVPYFLEIQYSENDFPDEKVAYSGSGFDPSKKEMILDEKNKHVVSKEFLRTEFLNKKRREIECLLLAFASEYVFSYPHIQGWFTELESVGGSNQSHYGQLIYLNNNESKEIDMLYSFENDRYIGNPLVLMVTNTVTNEAQHINMDDMFGLYYNANDVIRKAVFAATKQFHAAEGLANIDHTAKFLYHVYAIETLIGAEYRGSKEIKCDKCGQQIFAVRKKFHAFLQKYCNSYDKKAMDKIYDLRSSIVHTGKPISHPGFFTFEDQIDDWRQYYIEDQSVNFTRSVVKEVINKFLFMNSGGCTK